MHIHLNLGGIFRGIATGLETLAETGNPVLAARAGAPAAQNPLLQEVGAELPAQQQHVNALSAFAAQHPDFGSLVDPDPATA